MSRLLLVLALVVAAPLHARTVQNFYRVLVNNEVGSPGTELEFAL